MEEYKCLECGRAQYSASPIKELNFPNCTYLNCDGLGIEDLVLDKFWSEMQPFSDRIPDKNKRSKKKNKAQVMLSQWVK